MQGIFGVDTPFYRFMWKFVQLIWLTILWLLCSLPMVTIGASTTALYYVALKLAKNQEGYIAKDFFRSFRENFKQATIIFLLIAAVGVILICNLFYYWILWDSSVIVLRILFVLLAAVYLMILSYIFPSLAKFDNSIRNTVHFAFIMCIKNFGWTVVMLLISILVFLLSLALFGFPFLIAAGLTAFLQSFIFNRIFDSFIEQSLTVSEHKITNTEESLI